MVSALPGAVLGQKAQEYQYRREIKGVNASWHSFAIPNAVFGRVNYKTSDIKILGFNEKGDTLEVPYLNLVEGENVVKRRLDYEIIDRSDEEGLHYFTCKAKGTDEVNIVRVYFNESNYDWRVDLDWSEDGKEWKPLLRDYRIISVKNVLNNYLLNKVEFPKGVYPFIRIGVHCDQFPYLQKTSFAVYEVTGGNLQSYKIAETKTTHSEEKKTTLHEIKLENKVHVDQITIKLPTTEDFFRKIKIRYFFDTILIDGVPTPEYRQVYDGTVTSVAKNEYYLDRAPMQYLRFEVLNGPHPPFDLGEVDIAGFVQTIYAKFPAIDGYQYYLYYGLKERPPTPKYNLPKNPPDGLMPLILGDEELIVKESNKGPVDLFNNKWILGILAVLAVSIGFAAIKKLRNN